MSLTIQLNQFEGPLGLLLHLIRKEEMDIFDININQITKQYLESLKTMQKLDLERAGDFVAMAATLIQIKSKMLLPSHDGEIDDEDEGMDPRKDLVKKLIEYQKYQEASFALNERSLLGRDTFFRGSKTQIKPDAEVEDEIIVEENPLFSLISSYRGVLRAVRKTVHKVAGELKSISQRILELRDRLVVGSKTSYFMLIREKIGGTVTDEDNGATQNSKIDEEGNVLITFLSLLELARMGFVSLFQSNNYEDIYVDPLKEVDRDVISRADGFEAAGNALETSLSATLEMTDEDRISVEQEVEAQQEVSIDAFSDAAEESLEGFPVDGEVDFSLANKQWSEDGLDNDIASDSDIISAEEEMFGKSEGAEGLEVKTTEFSLDLPENKEASEDEAMELTDNNDIEGLI